MTYSQHQQRNNRHLQLKDRQKRLITLGIVAGLGLLVVLPRFYHGLDKDEQFKTVIDRKLALHAYAERADESEGKERERYLQLYFKAFPRDFETFYKMAVGIAEYCHGDYYYTINGNMGFTGFTNPWSSYVPIQKDVPTRADRPWEYPTKNKHLKYFQERFEKGDYPQWVKDLGIPGEEYRTLLLTLYHRPKPDRGWLPDILDDVETVIPKEIYYEKMLSAGVGGFYEADDVDAFRMHVTSLFYNEMPLAIKIMKRKRPREIASFFYFLFAGPHPDNYQEQYEVTYDELLKHDADMAFLLKAAYEEALKDGCSGH